MKYLSRIFTGRNFWLFNGTVSLIFAIIAVIVAANPMYSFIVMWISFAAADILKAIENKPTA